VFCSESLDRSTVCCATRMKQLLTWAFTWTLLGLALGSCSSSEDPGSSESGLQFVRDFVEASTKHCREVENPEDVTAQELVKVIDSATEHFSESGIFADNDPVLTFAVCSMLVPDLCFTDTPVAEVEQLLTITEVSKGSHEGNEWQTFYLEPATQTKFSRFTLCVTKKDGEWQIFAAYSDSKFVSALKELGYDSGKLLGFDRRWLSPGWKKDYDPKIWLLPMPVHYQAEKQGVWLKWRGKSLGQRKDGTWEGGYSAEQLASYIAQNIEPNSNEAALLCDGDIPLSYFRQVGQNSKEQVWKANILIPAPVDSLAYAIPVEIRGLAADEAAEATPWGKDSFQMKEDGRVEISLTEASDAVLFKDMIPLLVASLEQG
jgi:hypothetical protein